MSKKTGLTIGEMLQEVLVPEEEQPYKVPDNWVWTKMRQLIDVRDGTHDSPKYVSKGYPLITSKNLKSGKIDFSNVQFISEQDHISIGKRSKVAENDILFAMIGTIGNACMITDIKNDFSIKNVALFKTSNVINPTFLYRYLQSPQYLDPLIMNAKGSTQKFVALGILRNSKIPLPPINEQKRIADKVERLLDKIGQAKQLIEEARDTFELRRAAILDKAFRGDLTAKWRKEHSMIEPSEELYKRIKKKALSSDIKSNTNTVKPVMQIEEPYTLPKGWKWVRLGELAYYITSGSRDWSKYYSDKGAIFIRTQDINTNWLVLKDVAYMKLPDHVEGKRSLVERDDLLTTITGANVGKCAIVDFDISEAYVSQSVALTKLIDKSISKYIYYSLLSPIAGGGELLERAYGIGRPVLSLEDIKNIKIPLAPFEEQLQINEFLEEMFSKEEQASSLVQLSENMEQLSKTILSRAFRGELGTNDPSEKYSFSY